MKLAQAREILLLYRPGTRDAEDPQIIEAMELARQDPELAKWFAQHQAFQLAMRAKFREIEVPAHLQANLLAGRNCPTSPDLATPGLVRRCRHFCGLARISRFLAETLHSRPLQPLSRKHGERCRSDVWNGFSDQ